MTDDASLTDFTGGGDGDDDADDEPEPGDDAEPVEETVDGESDAETDEPTAADETPTFTYTSTPDGAECAACSTEAEKRWRTGEGGAADAPDLDPDALVCPDCKEW